MRRRPEAQDVTGLIAKNVVQFLNGNASHIHMPDPPQEPVIGHAEGETWWRGMTALGWVLGVDPWLALKALGKEGKTPENNWSEWQDLNLRPLRPERSALPG